MRELRATPIPGMSLTGTPGNNPWEQPPQYSSLDDVVAFYTEKLTTEKAVDNLLSAMEANTPLLTMANGMIKAGVMKGIHTIDAGFVAIPIIVELMKTIGDMNDVGYIVEDEDFIQATEVDEKTAMEVLKSAVAEVKQVPAVRQAGLMSKE
jgi:hypothetical protein